MRCDSKNARSPRPCARLATSTGHFGKWHLDGLRGPGVPVLATDPRHPGAFGSDEWLSPAKFFDRDPLLSRQGRFEEFAGDLTNWSRWTTVSQAALAGCVASKGRLTREASASRRSSNGRKGSLRAARLRFRRPTGRPSRLRSAPPPSFTRPGRSPASSPRVETIAMRIESCVVECGPVLIYVQSTTTLP